MVYVYIFGVYIILNVICDLNYFIRTLFTVMSGRLYQNKLSLNCVTTIYGICTLQDCDISFKSMRIARLLRELDFARYHFYDKTGIYARSKELSIASLQGCTYIDILEPVPLFRIYKINTKLVYWDDRSLFLEHEVIRLHDGKICTLMVSQQHAIGKYGDSTESLLRNLPGSEKRPSCPAYIQSWLYSMAISSERLRN